MLIKNLNLANCKIVIGEAEPIKFDESGKVEIAPELGQELLKLKGYELVEEKEKDPTGADESQPDPKETTLATGTVEVEEMKVGEPRKELKVGEATEMADDEEIDYDEKELLPNYETLTTKELKDLIKEKGEKAPSGATKADLIEILNNLEK
ncbi:hypothetical protein [uncultured Anaerococcus sp.]|uniref:hypothetical protein n=1 Tax=uncultured Anaerococcus sp. TaxID=293428 RepID=UPI00280A9EA1|nr:hypothetical protein [uncultured Anaerococcus sp.]